MRKFYLLSTLVLTILFGKSSFAQDFSNKGKDFYLCFPAHVPSSNNATLSIWITSDKASSGTVTMGNFAFSSSFNIPANGRAEIQVPHSAAHISNAESNMVIRKSIRIRTDPGKPAVVAYAQQWAGARSAATLVLPVNVLGKKYYSVNFTQNSGGRSQFDIIAIKDNTVIRITPYLNGVKGAAIIVNLPLAGDMYQYQSSNTTADLTGTLIESIVSASGGCLPIAVFSGSSNISMGTSTCGSFNSADPLFQQLYPVSTWGKNFGFVPFANYPNGSPFRVLASEDNTNVYFNGTLTATLNAGQIYPAAFTSQPITLTQPTSISADKPISTIQYAQSSGCNGNGNIQGDPDMVVLNPIEQSIKDITIFSTRQQVINTQWLNILVKSIATPSFRISRNGGPLNPPNGTWQPFPSLPGYSYLREQLPTPGDGGIGSPPGTVSDSYRLLADSGFNAICYGWGDNESYAYSAGTNVKDLYQQIGVSTEFGIEPTPSVCKGSPFKFKVSLPYCADSILWDLSFLPGPPAPPPTVLYTTCTPGPGGPDSTTVVNGKTLYWYSLPSTYNFATAGTFPVTITIYTPNTDGCGSEQEIDFELNVFDPPIADFTSIANGCAAEPVQFNDNTVTPRPSYIWNWDFGDPASGAANTSTLQNPTHIFSGPGSYNVTFSTITTPGCISGQIVKPVVVAPLPSGSISGSITVCLNAPSPDITFTGSGGRAPYTFTYNINSGPNQTISTTGTNTSVTLQPPTNVAGTFRYNLVEIKNTGSTLCLQPISNAFVDIIVVANVTMNLTSPAGTNNQTICENTPIANIIYTIVGGTGANVTGLPAGVTGVYNAGVFTISGTPVGGGTFNYTVTSTGPCGQQTANGSITVNPDAVITLISAAATTNQQVCNGNAIATITYAVSGGGTGAGVTGLPAGVTAVFAGGVLTISGTPTATGVFNYTVTTTGTCVQKTATGTITVGSDATLTLTSAPATTNQTVCINNPITTITYSVADGGTGAGVTGLPAGLTGIFAGGTVTISGIPTVSGTFNYSVITTGTCAQQTGTGTITVNPDATIVLTSAPATELQEMCFNTAITTITYAISDGGTGATVSGLPAGVSGVYSGGVFTINGTATVSGTFNYTVTTTGNSCIQKTETGTIIINPLPTANFSATAPACDTRVISFTDLSSPNVGSLSSWSWNFGDPLSGANNTSPNANPTHIFTGTGTYNVTLTVSNNKGCVSSPVLSIPVTVNAKPLAGFMVPEVCINDVSALFTDTSKILTGALDPLGYEWDFGDPASGPLNTSTTKDGSHLYTAVGLYTVRHIATSALGCKDTVYHNIFINGANPNADYSVQNSAALCSNDSISITNLSTISAGTITKVDIYWDFVGAPTVVETDDFPAPNKIYKHKYPTLQTTNSYTVRFVAYSGTLCLDIESKTIVVNATPKVQFLTIPDVCLDAAPFPITQASEVGAVPGPPGVFSGPGVSPSGIFNPALVGPGTYMIKYTFTSTAGGCVDSLSQPITVLDSASARFTFSTLTCEKTAVDFSSTSSTIPPGVGTITGWVWDFGDPASGAANTSNAPNPTHLFSSWGTYNVRLYVTTSRGCRSTVRTIPVTVNPIARPNFTFPPSACLPSATVAFNSAASSIPDGSQASFSYLWNFGDPASGALNTATGSSPSHIYNTAGPFNVNLQITSGAGCVHDTTIILNTIHPQPTGSFTADKTDVCVGQGFTFTNTSDPADGTTQQYSWSMGDNNTRSTPVVNYSYGAAGSYDVTLFITNSHGCRSSVATKTVTVNPYPTVNAGPDLFILQGGSDTLEPIISNDINPTYLWTQNLYFIGSNTVRNPIVKGVEDITYTLVVTGRGGCSAEDKVFIKVLKGPEIPNIFSPNGDGIHDRWDIKYLDTYPGGTVEIFNRYGQMIWRSVGYGTPWDGTIGGNPVPIGTYYYIVNPKNGRSIMTGYVDVIR